MSVNVFKEPRSNLPKDDPKVVRVAFDQVEMGAQKGFISKIPVKNDNTIRHVGS